MHSCSPWQSLALLLTTVMACDSTGPAPSPSQPAPSALAAPTTLDVIVVDERGGVSRTTTTAPMIVLSSSKLELEAMAKALDKAGVLDDELSGSWSLHAAPPSWLFERPCQDKLCLTVPPPPPPEEWTVYVLGRGQLAKIPPEAHTVP